MKNLMDLKQLNCFVAVAEERHLGRAAERLCLSQPPLTRHIQNLEQQLGVELFTRTSRGMTLTQAGEGLLDDARSVLGMLEQVTERARRSALGQLGRLDVGLYGSATFGLVPTVLAAFKRAHPEVDISLHYAQTPAQIPALRQGRVQLVFERFLPTESDIEIELVAREPLMLAVCDSHPLATSRRVDVAALRDETLIIGSSPTMAAATLELCRRNGFEPRFAPPTSDVIMSALQVAIGTGVALVPESMSRVHVPGLVYLPLQSKCEALMDLHCFYLKGNESPLLHGLLDTVRRFRADSAARRTMLKAA